MNKEEKELRNKEADIIKQKAEYIADHSLYILDNIKDEKFLSDFTFFLLSDNATEFSEIPEKINPRDYYSSLSVIFKVCENLKNLGYNEEESKNLRDKLRIYTKYFKEDNIDLLKASDFVKINAEQLNKSLEQQENEEKSKSK